METDMETQDRTIWVANTVQHNFSAAKNFGTVKFVMAANDSPFDVKDMIEQFDTVLDKEVKEDDYLLITGWTVANMIFLVQWFKHFDCEKVYILLYHAKKKGYLVREIPNPFFGISMVLRD